MKKARRGFTLIEISFFLALTGALFVGIAVGTQNSLWQQKYNDSVQSFTNFLRNAYSQVSNPQGAGDGRSNRAIYGKLIVFGQDYDLKGDRIPSDEQRIFIYDVVGDATAIGTGSIIKTFKELNINVLVEEVTGGVITNVSTAGYADSYMPTWGSVIERTTLINGENNNFRGSILIVRHPRSGIINTLFSDRIIPVNETIRNARLDGNYDGTRSLLTSRLDHFDVGEINFCVNPYGMGVRGSFRRDIRIVGNARNSSGVEIVDQDSPENHCK
jgi:type II secretory pathway pseudopilin PulG